MSTTMPTSGPLYQNSPDSGWYRWECPVCGDICEDRERIKETECHNGHQVFLAVIGTIHDGFCMTANLKQESE